MRFKTIFKPPIDFNRFPLLIHIVWVLNSCSPEPQRVEHRMVFRYNSDNGITSLDPAFARSQDNMWPVGQLFNGLVQLDSQLQVIPSLAKSWHISEDGRVYTFTLRKGVLFHRHKVFHPQPEKNLPLTRTVRASDVVYSFKRIMDPETASPGAWIFNDKVDQNPFVALNDSMVQITLRNPFPPFLGLLTMPYCYIVPKEAVLYYGKDFGRQPVGTGPFVFKQWKEEVKLILLKNPDYFEFENQTRLPYLDAIAISFLADKQAAFLEFLQGNLDFFNGLESSFKDEIIERDGSLKPKYTKRFTTQVTPFLNTEYLAFLVDDSLPHAVSHPFHDKRVRQAVQCGINKAAIIKHLRNNIGKSADAGFIPLGLPGYAPEAALPWQYNPAKAKKLLETSGYLNHKKRITLHTTKDYLDICLFVQRDLKAVGMDIAIEVQPASFLKEEKSNNKLLFFRGSWISDYPDAENYLACFYSRNFSPSGPNYTHFKNADYDRLYNSLFTLPDAATRVEVYKKMEAVLMEESPVVPLFYDQSFRLIQHGVLHLKNNPTNALDLRRVQIKNL